MNHIFENKEYKDTVRINTLPFRSHYIPFSKEQEFSFKHGIIDKNASNLVINLNGIWEFKEHKTFSSLTNIDEELKDTIEVPSCVQMKGYDYIQYTNIKYPFPYNPPHIPEENPAFHYRKVINLNIKDKYYLVFEGVDNCFYLYVNEQYVGFSTISHSKSEFDITKYLRNGDNVLDVVVLKWSKSSYLEDQDKFRFSGIFRDVYLLNRKEKHIWDYKIEPILQNNEWYLSISNLSSSSFFVEIEGNVSLINPKENIKILINNPVLWSPETPHLYNVILFNDDEKILERIGLRRVHIKDGVFYINGEHIKLKGVNRHESNPLTGATVSIEDTLNDIKLIKSINANAIRTSHYPDIPEFYELCDFYGLYVLNEADLETHGACQGEDVMKSWREFTNLGLFNQAYLEREISLYERDKNKTCVIIWSLGNESYWGDIFYAGADYIKQRDSRPIHYEGVYSIINEEEYYTDKIDIISMMYPTLDIIREKHLNNPKEKRPLCLCEYTHAMGNSCGDIRDYWELINSTDKIIGAFVWEWCDHAVEIDGKLLFGADFPERHHDGHFCVDGLVSPYRKFKSSTLEVKSIYGGKYQPDIIAFEPIEIDKKPCKSLINAIFDEQNASIKTLLIGERQINFTPIKPYFHRAYTDNDLSKWDEYERFKKANLKVIKKTIEENIATFECVLEENNDEPLLKFSISYILNDMSLIIDYRYEILKEISPTRVGLYFSVSKIEDFEFIGYGPDESYVDKCVHNTYNKHHYFVKDNLPELLYPQECGSRYGVTNLVTKDFEIVAEKHYCFTFLNYSVEEIEKAQHVYELIEDECTYVNLDLFNIGVGSAACGPKLLEKYQVPKTGNNCFKINFKL